MKKLLSVTIALTLLGVTAPAQDVRIFTRPSSPPRDVLRRLALTEAWKVKLPTEGMNDGFYSLQIIPSKGRAQIVAQTFGGAVFLVDAETGDVLWRTQAGVRNWAAQPVGFNDSNIFVTRRNLLYVLNRANGQQRVYVVDPQTKQVSHGFDLEYAPSATPSAEEDRLYFVLGDRVVAYKIPDWEAEEKTILPSKDKTLNAEERQILLEKRSALQPVRDWSYLSANLYFEHVPLLTEERVSVVSTNGHVISLNKFGKQEKEERFDFKTGGNVVAAMGQYNIMAYVGSEDYTLYALHMKLGVVSWRFLSGAPIRVKPLVTDKDVFVTSGQRGLFRIDLDHGREIWHSERADRLLSTNQKFAYAVDRTGTFLVLDYARGTILANYDLRDWVMNIPNELTDRIYLASHDGQIMCLHHKDLIEPMKLKTFIDPDARKKVVKQPEKQEEPIDKEKGKEKEKENIKDKDKEKAGDKEGEQSRAVEEASYHACLDPLPDRHLPEKQRGEHAVCTRS